MGVLGGPVHGKGCHRQVLGFAGLLSRERADIGQIVVNAQQQFRTFKDLSVEALHVAWPIQNNCISMGSKPFPTLYHTQSAWIFRVVYPDIFFTKMHLHIFFLRIHAPSTFFSKLMHHQLFFSQKMHRQKLRVLIRRMLITSSFLFFKFLKSVFTRTRQNILIITRYLY